MVKRLDELKQKEQYLLEKELDLKIGHQKIEQIEMDYLQNFKAANNLLEELRYFYQESHDGCKRLQIEMKQVFAQK
jgi:hypothetical protein